MTGTHGAREPPSQRAPDAAVQQSDEGARGTRAAAPSTQPVADGIVEALVHAGSPADALSSQAVRLEDGRRRWQGAWLEDAGLPLGEICVVAGPRKSASSS